MAIIDIPYIVEFWNETEKRQWKKSYGAVSPFEIQEISSQEAPVAIKWINNDERQLWPSNQTRWYDNAHWLPLEFHDREKGNHVHLTLKAYQLMVGRSFTTNGRLDGFSSSTKRLESSELKQYFKGEIKEISIRKPAEKYSWSNHEQARNDIFKALSELIIIDDQIWTKTPEPVLTLSASKDATTIIPTANRPSQRRSGFFFRIDRMDDFLSQMQFERPNLPQILTPEIHISIPESILFNDEEHSLRAAAGKILDLSKELLPFFEWEEVKCWYDLHKSLYRTSTHNIDLEYLANLIEDVETTFHHHFDDPNATRSMVHNTVIQNV